jgi:uncharacterized membrane protein
MMVPAAFGKGAKIPANPSLVESSPLPPDRARPHSCFRYANLMERNRLHDLASHPTSQAVNSHGKPLPLTELQRRRRPLRDINKEAKEKLSRLDRLAVWITAHVGTMGFFLVVFVWTACWLGWNFLAPKPWQFDPPMAFVFWLFISNMIQLFLMPLIMVGQNVQGTHAELRAESDLEVNVKAEKEIETILQHLEYQDALLITLVKKLDAEISGTKPSP